MNIERRQMTSKKSWKRRTLDYLQEFAEETTIHGIRHIFAPHRHPIETVLWLLVTGASAAYAIWVIVGRLERYENNPTVVSLERDEFNWNFTFPATTVCLQKKLNETAIDGAISRRWPSATEEEKPLLRDFISSIANIDFENLEAFDKFANDVRFESIKDDMLDIALEVQWESIPVYQNAEEKDFGITLVLLELGLCYTTCSAVAHYVSPSSLKLDIDKSPPMKEAIQCHSTSGGCNGLMKVLNTMQKIYVHSPYDLPTVIDKYDTVEADQSIQTTYATEDIRSDPAVRSLKVSQRHCKLISEPQGKLPFTSYNLCTMQCRIRLAVDLCGCAPFFYLTSGVRFEVCNATGLACIARHREDIIHLDPSNKKWEQCSCLQLCDVILYRIISHSGSPGFRSLGGFSFYSVLLQGFSKNRYKKSILFGIEELLVSYGGIAGFFLGCSLLSLVELIYFFTLRLWYKLFQRFCSKEHVVSSEAIPRLPKRLRHREIWLSVHTHGSNRPSYFR